MSTTYDATIEEIGQSIFATMLNMELFRVETPEVPPADTLLAGVQIAGEWMGSVVIGLTEGVARAATAAMLEMDPAEVTPNDEREVAAELANMVGGNLKSLLPGPSFLSLPTIISGRELGLRVHDAELLDDVTLMSEFGPLHVCLYGQKPRVVTEPTSSK